MKLSIIIVNYNVKYFLQQCLQSVRKAVSGMEAEVFVVDNTSSDGSVEMVKSLFPEVQLIVNTVNAGFSKANNQAIRKSTGEYVLLLNPDTVVEEDTFRKVCAFMDEHPEAGGLGVYMIDGKGNFLPESKRGLPTPAVAFYKIFGLSALFPKSKTFGRYHLGYLDKEKTHAVDVLSGAFMLMRRETLDKTGLLDEDYFMYGEDIDLSYRITRAGYKNYYFPGTRIIHYKGESTKKSSVNYVFVFYKAMVIFARKHFAPGNAALFAVLINMAIWLRAGLSIVKRFIDRIWLPLADGLIIYSGMIAIKNYWSINAQVALYPPFFMNVVVPVYILIWIVAAYLSGGYDFPVRISRMIRGLLTGTVVILVGYALLPEDLRFSRALILFGTAWASLSVTITRFGLHFSGMKKFRLADSIHKRLLIAGDAEESRRILSLLMMSGSHTNYVGYVSDEKEENNEMASHHLGTMDALPELVGIYEINEIIFCGKNLTSASIISQMHKISKPDVEIKIAPPESLYIIGSNSINERGDFYLIDVSTINNAVNKRNKRLFDLAVCFTMLLLLPVFFLLADNKTGFIRNLCRVFTGSYSWVGSTEHTGVTLTGLKPGIFSPSMIARVNGNDAATRERLMMLYAKDYKVYNDLRIILHHLKDTGR